MRGTLMPIAVHSVNTFLIICPHGFIVYKSKSLAGKMTSNYLDADVITQLGKKLNEIGAMSTDEAQKVAENALVRVIQPEHVAFVLVRTGCHYSKNACAALVKLGLNNIIVFNVVVHGFVEVVNFEHGRNTSEVFKDLKEVGKIVLDSSLFGNIVNSNRGNVHTVPEIFLWRDNQWDYLGGCDNIQTYVDTTPSTTAPKSAKYSLRW